MKLKTLLITAVAAIAVVATASVTHNIVQTYQTAGGSIVGSTVVTDNTELNCDVTMATNTVNGQVNLALKRSQLCSLCLYSTVAATVKMNSSNAPTDTILLLPATPQIGTGTNALSLSGDVTNLWLTCTNPGTFSLRAVLHMSVP